MMGVTGSSSAFGVKTGVAEAGLEERKEGGLGLGLSLCAEIARLHHARLEIESRPEAGTTVKVVFQDEA